MQKLATLPNVYVKISMLGYAVPGWWGDDGDGGGEKRALAKGIVKDLVAWFGAKRCMLATNWHINAVVSDSDGLSASSPSPAGWSLVHESFPFLSFPFLSFSFLFFHSILFHSIAFHTPELEPVSPLHSPARPKVVDEALDRASDERVEDQRHEASVAVAVLLGKALPERGKAGAGEAATATLP